jgi:hypothetical protein
MGVEWKAYEFRWKPGALDRAPAFIGPDMPRLDWQMWFAALTFDRGSAPHWFRRFIERLGANAPEATALLEINPFADHPPVFLRCLLYDYRFTDRASRAGDGAWWRRELKRELFTVPVDALKRWPRKRP